MLSVSVVGVFAVTGTGTSHAQGGGGSSGGGGPIVLMGIDAEDGGSTGHGPIEVYQDVMTSVLNAVNNGGEDILVVGAGKNPNDNVTDHWDALVDGIDADATYVNGAEDILAVDFAGFAVIAIASTVFDTSSGGLTNEESTALSQRAGDIALFVNRGGGLHAYNQRGLDDNYGFLNAIGLFEVNHPAQYSSITPTPLGEEIGITTALNVCCWHDTYPVFPDFLDVLATAPNGEPAAVGGVDVVIPTGIELFPVESTATVIESVELTAEVTLRNLPDLEPDDPRDPHEGHHGRDNGENGENGENGGIPVVDTTVTFSVVSGPNAGTTGEAQTDADGRATFVLDGTTEGTDVVEATYVDDFDRVQTSNQATVAWLDCNPFVDVTVENPFCFDIEWMEQEGYANGWPDDTYRPGVDVSRQAKAAFLWRMEGSQPAEPGHPTFSDVPETNEFYDAISWLAQEGITEGFPDGTYRPVDNISRQATAAFMWRLAGSPEPAPGHPTFSDVPETSEFYDAISWFAGEGITDGYADGTFRPTEATSRQSKAAFLRRWVEVVEAAEDNGDNGEVIAD
ncbi:MAG: S-layer homology domain-containing protein [Acidimicrobiia bacterium]|nr:S-layer homology domain-containing protein [Acidimicrobiia bacterium]